MLVVNMLPVKPIFCAFTYSIKDKDDGNYNDISQSEAQKSLLKSLLKEMKVHFEISKFNDETLMTERGHAEFRENTV